jgi:uncharacterized protein (DUF952 family)
MPPVLAAPELVYKIAPAEDFAEVVGSGRFEGMAIDLKDGFVHLSTAAQLSATLGLHFRGQTGLVLIALRTADLAGALRWEPSRGGDLFPHYYGALPLSAVAWTEPLAVGADGTVALPEAVR